MPRCRGTWRDGAHKARSLCGGSAAAAAPCRLLALSDDEVGVVERELYDPLRPPLAVKKMNE